MASIYKAKWTKYWLITYHDHDGKRKTKNSKTTDKRAAQRIAANFEANAALRREGVIDPREDKYAQAETRPLSEHLADFERSMKARDVTEGHCHETCTMIRKLLERGELRRISDLTAARVTDLAGQLKAEGKSHRTVNKYLTAIKAFGKWLKQEGQAREHALESVTTFNVDRDPRRTRRDPTDAELAKLIEVTRTRDLHRGMTGDDRAMLYEFAASTGFRAAELRSLTPASFDLDGCPPTVTVEAGYAKAGRTDAQPIGRGLAERLRAWLAEKGRGEPVFKRMTKNTARTLSWDLKAARAQWIAEAETDADRKQREGSEFLTYEDAEGRVFDFHALRGAYISRLERSGATVKTLQTLARHADPRLTLKRYARVNREDEVRAVAAVPSFGGEG
jgi:integrase